MSEPKYKVGDVVKLSPSLVIFADWPGLVKILEVVKDRRADGTYDYLVEDVPPADKDFHYVMHGVMNESNLHTI